MNGYEMAKDFKGCHQRLNPLNWIYPNLITGYENI